MRRSGAQAYSTELNLNTQAPHAVPVEAVSRRAISWDGISIEIIQSITHDEVEFPFRGAWPSRSA